MKRKIIAWVFVFLWMMIIFFFSNMNADESNKKSTKTIYKVIETIEKTNQGSITNEPPSNEKTEKLIYQLNKPFRKCMHAFVYLVFAFLVLNALKQNHIIEIKKYGLCIIICFLYALTDEFHQTFVLGRSGEYFDVLIDTFGSIIGCIFYKIGTNIFRKSY